MIYIRCRIEEHDYIGNYIGLYRIEEEDDIHKMKDTGYTYINIRQCENYVGLYRIEKEDNICKIRDSGYIYTLRNVKII